MSPFSTVEQCERAKRIPVLAIRFRMSAVHCERGLHQRGFSYYGEAFGALREEIFCISAK